MLRNESLLKFLGLNTQGDLGPWTFYTSKRHGLVWFVKAPPLEPPSFLQTHQRNQFRLVGLLWSYLDRQQKANWELASKQAHLRINGYNLFTYWALSSDDAAINSVAAQTQIPLLPIQRTTP